MNFLTCFIILFAFSLKSNAQISCKTPIGESGQCVPKMTCSIIRDIENLPKPLPPKPLDYLQRSRCPLPNNEPHVCCSPRHIKENSINTNTNNNNNNNNVVIMEDQPDGVVDVSNHPNINLHPIRDCGETSDRKISNGNDTIFGEFPWMALLRYDTPDGLAFRCGGSLISKRYILTAAHCVTGTGTPLVSVRLGDHDISTEKDCLKSGFCAPPFQDIEVEQIISHPSYNRPRFSNDIALIRLKNDAEFVEDSVLPICLPINAETQRRQLEKVIISGWGLTEKQITSTKLLKALVTVLPNEECIRVFGRLARITTSQMCAGGGKGVDSCQGDSGGPLAYLGNVRGPRFVQYGIISAGAINCGGDGNLPGIYTRVSYYMKWILDNMKP